ncbi:hypothetical protein [Companilactobacillus furfuricola]|uniref:hypothetical protein n=1 Tax=Companilactobacillus furfuricola TaxID=1462575 RepID=UPI0013DDBD1A|nr:hypothetical protein [Companilactobacillus furfuricola]
MTRVLEIVYWLIVGAIAITTVLLYYYSEKLFQDSSLLLLAILLVRQYETSLPKNPLEKYHH